MFFNFLKRNKIKLILVCSIISIIVLVKLVLIDIVYVNQQYEKNRIATPWGEKIKSGNLSVDYSIDQTLLDISRLGLNTVNVPVEVNIPTLSSNTMMINPASEKKAIELIKKLRYKGINIIIEPYPFINNGEQYETQLKPTDLNEWFSNWKQTVLAPIIHDVVKPYKVYALCIASNFEQIDREYDHWADIADFVRANFQGRITYKTNWWYTAEWDTEKDGQNDTYTKKLNNPVLGKVDFISVAAYFELTDKGTNSVEDLVSDLRSTQIYKRHQDVSGELKDLSAKWGKQVFFGELGFPKTNGAAIQPWNPAPSTITNEQEQANCFAAYKEVFEKETWNLGFSVFAIGKIDENKSYYPGDQSIQVIYSWYK